MHYRGAELYRANPTTKYDGDVAFVSIPVYSSKDLVNWKFENRVATRSTPLAGGAALGQAGWVGRLGVSYNENTGKYVLVVQVYLPSLSARTGCAPPPAPPPGHARRAGELTQPVGGDVLVVADRAGTATGCCSFAATRRPTPSTTPITRTRS